MDYYDELLSSYQRKGLLVDSNLLLLLVVGACDRNRISKWKRTMMFTPEDFDLLVAVIGRFETVVTTPNILTEVSNFLGQLPGEARNFYAQFSAGIEKLDEHFILSRSLSSLSSFPKLGLTDTGIIEEARGKYLVLTADLPLYAFLVNAGTDAINFNDLRTGYLLS
ncbi:MAG: hypothetical protein LAP13_17355 [Acidobacteriia bacterium]|nr:hypothetical protein [Terriglobia bacterium]